MLQYCTSTMSTVSLSFNVSSITFPVVNDLILLRVNGVPLPGVMCCDKVTTNRSPLRLMTDPFFTSVTDAIIQNNNSSLRPNTTANRITCQRCVSSLKMDGQILFRATCDRAIDENGSRDT